MNNDGINCIVIWITAILFVLSMMGVIIHLGRS